MNTETNKSLHTIIAQKIIDLMEQSETSQLPPEYDLAKQFEVSRNTIREALSNLDKKGILLRRKGHGNFLLKSVIKKSMPLNLNGNFKQLIQHAGYVPRLERLFSKYDFPDRALREILDLEADEIIVTLDWTFYADEIPAVFIKQHIPKKYLHTLPDDVLVDGDEIDKLHTFENYTSQTFSHVIFDFIPTQDLEIAERFKLVDNPHLMKLVQKSYNIEDTVIASSTAFLNPEIMTLSMASNI